jgi:putative ABC transport system permease protein
MQTAPGFIWKMAWRDSRSSRRRLLVFSISITLGIAALVSIGSFRNSLAQAIDEQARTLIGADLIVIGSRPFTPQEEEFFRSLGGPQAREVRFTTMAVFPNGGTRLVQVRALGGAFPFYGTMETDPPAAAAELSQGRRIIVDESVLIQFGARVGEAVKLGELEFTVAGGLRKVPGEASAAASFAPRVYIPLQDLGATNLLQPGSIARYRNYVKFPDGADANALVAKLSPQIEKFGLEYDTVERRKRELGRALENLYRFLNLVGFVALLLGAVGVASAIQAHLQQKHKTGAILRCLGASARSTVVIYLLQAAAMGLVGATAGAALGLVLQRVFPAVLQSFIALPIPTTISWEPVIRGMLIGFVTCVLFALPALLRFRRLSPLLIIRASVEDDAAPRRRDVLVLFTYFVIAASVTAFAIAQSETVVRGLAFAGGLFVAVAIFAAMARLLMVLVKRFFPSGWSFAVRQGLANLYRPNNRTLLLTVALGLGTFLMLNLYLTREVLLSQFSNVGASDQPNIFLFDIQPDQAQEVAETVRSFGLPVIQEAPIVSMKLAEIKGRPTADILRDPQRKIPEWQLQRDYRVTYREGMTETEKLTAGEWVGRVENFQPTDVVPISIDREIARDFDAVVGDELVFDVQGVPIRTRIASTREIDWRRFQTNFFVVFPVGVLENAPGFHVLVSRVNDAAQSAQLQSAVVTKFPNVSAVDLMSVIETVDSILSKVALVIRVMSLFTVGAGLVVLASTIWSGRFQRLKESVLLRTLGASRAQIWKILCAEYAALGLLASTTGIVLAVISSWALARFVFELSYAPPVWPLLIAAGAVTLLTVAIGLLTSRGIGNTPPLEILRAEAE